MQSDRLNPVRTMGRILTFRARREEFEQFDNRHLALGLLCTWLAGMGRSWDNPRAELARHLGVGSVVYVFALSLLLWVVVRPFCKPGISYRRVLTFICLVSPPAFIYAIPVEKFFSAETARDFNMAFLALVAAWRVALLFFYFGKIEGLRWYELLVTTLLPLATIMAPLKLLNDLISLLETMGDLRGHKFTDPVEATWNFLGIVSIWAFLPLLCAYFEILERKWRKY